MLNMLMPCQHVVLPNVQKETFSQCNKRLILCAINSFDADSFSLLKRIQVDATFEPVYLNQCLPYKRLCLSDILSIYITIQSFHCDVRAGNVHVSVFLLQRYNVQNTKMCTHTHVCIHVCNHPKKNGRVAQRGGAESF